MDQLEQVLNVHMSEPGLDRKKPELVKGEQIRQEGTGTYRNLP
jgi:hypothetical protein